MEKKNTLLLTVIAVATLLVAVVGATFAYFGSFTPTVDEKAAVNVQTGTVQASTFITTGGTLSLNVPGSAMTKGQEGDLAESVGTKNGSANLVVKLNYPDTATQMTCTYDIMFEYDIAANNNETGAAIYGFDTTPVSDGTEGKEFTYTLTPSTGITVEGAYVSSESQAKSFSIFSSAKKGNPVVVAKGSITATGTTEGKAVTQNLLADVKFYNFPTIDQSALAGKTFSGSFYVDQSTLKCSTAAKSGS